MIGNAESHLALLSTRLHTYLPVDGGTGALVLARLAGQSPTWRAVNSPRHADALLIIAPVAASLLPAITNLAQALPAGGRILVASAHPDAVANDQRMAEVMHHFPGAQPLAALTLAALTAALSQPTVSLRLPTAPQIATDLIDLPQEHEIATELTVLSLGPIQPFTAGPARFWLICDGEQVLECRVAAGYAARDSAGMMVSQDWQGAAVTAAQFDPLAPIASRLAFVRAIERLQGHTPLATTQLAREEALEMESARNWLWWSVRFLRQIELTPLALQAQTLADALDAVCLQEGPEPATNLIPGRSFPAYDAASRTALHDLASAAHVLVQRVQRDRWLRLRTAGIGIITAQTAQDAGVSGPILGAAQQGQGDVQARLVKRLTQAADALNDVATGSLSLGDTSAPSQGNWQVPAGTAHGQVHGPRGDLGVQVVSDGGDHPIQIAWERPSAAALRIVPVVLMGQKVADAEVILASLDLVMAEADG